MNEMLITVIFLSRIDTSNGGDLNRIFETGQFLRRFGDSRLWRRSGRRRR